jgi:hypothetical protein
MLPLVLTLAAAWPSTQLEALDARTVERGDIVARRSVADGVIDTLVATRVDADVDWLYEQTRKRLCGRESMGSQVLEIRFFDTATFEAAASAAGAELDRDAVDAIAKGRCEHVVQRDVFYAFNDFDEPALMPDMWSVLRFERRRLKDGSYRVRVEQVAGTLGSMRTQTVMSALGPRSARYVTHTRVRPGLPVPDVALRSMMKPVEDSPARRRAVRFRNEAQARAMRPQPPPPGLQGTPGG